LLADGFFVNIRADFCVVTLDAGFGRYRNRTERSTHTRVESVRADVVAVDGLKLGLRCPWRSGS
jgi:hypothetical protein